MIYVALDWLFGETEKEVEGILRALESHESFGCYGSFCVRLGRKGSFCRNLVRHKTNIEAESSGHESFECNIGLCYDRLVTLW